MAVDAMFIRNSQKYIVFYLSSLSIHVLRNFKKMPVEKFQTEVYDEGEANILEYMIKVADVFAPDIAFDSNGTPHKVDSQAPFIFKRRYNNGILNVYFNHEEYLGKKSNDNEKVIDIIRALGIDPVKFWYLLLFISDYVSGSTLNTLVCEPTPKQGIEGMINFIEQNVESVSAMKGVTPKHEMEMTLRIKGRTLKIHNPNTLSAIALFCREALPSISEGSILNSVKVRVSDLPDYKRIGLFADMFRCFFDLYPQFSSKRKSGNSPTKSTLLLISKLAYFTKLTVNKDYYFDDENIKGVLKLYHKHNLNTINTIYG